MAGTGDYLTFNLVIIMNEELGINEQQEKEVVTIDREAYEELLSDARFLQCLQSAGVDNWEGYEIAQDMFEENE